jgi:mRNA interferase RelE/StbE
MKVHFESSFEKDLRKIRDQKIRVKLKALILAVKQAVELSDLPNLLKLKGYETYYRIRVGDYRIGLEVLYQEDPDDIEIVFVRVLHRKDIYRHFPY